jgi:hypothetical protein
MIFWALFGHFHIDRFSPPLRAHNLLISTPPSQQMSSPIFRNHTIDGGTSSPTSIETKQALQSSSLNRKENSSSLPLSPPNGDEKSNSRLKRDQVLLQTATKLPFDRLPGLVGRDKEVATLQECLKRICTGDKIAQTAKPISRPCITIR